MNWNETVDEVAPKLYRYFCCSFPEPAAQDLVQEVLVRLVQKYRDGKFDPIRGSMTMFAFGIAHHVRLETLRSLRKNERLSNAISDSVDERAFQPEISHEVDALREALLQLKEIERQIILLHLDQDLTLTQISNVLGMPVGTIKSHIHRAKKVLREILNER